MPRGRKRKTPAEEMEAALQEPAAEKPAGNIIGFEQILRDSNIANFNTVQSHASQVPSISNPSANIVAGCGGGLLGSLPKFNIRPNSLHKR
ncbi:hypothetical protein DPMN_181266 [Dreissena polymorpha]|uniref:Uncharacterized protein n=1 Tax=Dreissena polymorpha TaxID=45954 RepID=A0A9D4DCI1_DREPO|nr:hypothetical protein DPMN_181266 [Dreissena polymorpha]